ncbi:protein-L-isoaspartate O-methyltransferase family protein [Bradyrhizobium sp. SYSU BS000235]|uniref:protein-L-isoaspartate O-methyltransferase family protein n=1 Tax=Bradyrhizobium sp. SYSU BS000235 TaxID=3411332 RepID=UPI003C75DB9E
MSEFSTARQKMVDGQVRPSDVTDLRILDAMLAVPREDFVPAAQRPIAYLDLDIEVGGVGTAKRYLIKPVVLAKMLQAASIAETDRVLVVGCATGYSAAIVSRLAGEVFATESDAALAGAAKTNLSQIGIANVTIGTAEAAAGDAAHGPYDVIVLDGATEIEPEGLFAQLKPAGRLVGVFATTQPPRANLVTRSAGDFGSRVLFDAFAPILPGMQRLPAFTF